MDWSAIAVAALGGGALGSLLTRTTEAQKALRAEMIEEANRAAGALRAATLALEALATQDPKATLVRRGSEEAPERRVSAIDEAEIQIAAASQNVAAMHALFASEIYFLGESAVDDLAHALRLAREVPGSEDESRGATFKALASARLNASAFLEVVGADIRRPLGIWRSVFRAPRFGTHIGTAIAVESRRATRKPGEHPRSEADATRE